MTKSKISHKRHEIAKTVRFTKFVKKIQLAATYGLVAHLHAYECCLALMRVVALNPESLCAFCQKKMSDSGGVVIGGIYMLVGLVVCCYKMSQVRAQLQLAVLIFRFDFLCVARWWQSPQPNFGHDRLDVVANRAVLP
jgi:hypothetical protein